MNNDSTKFLVESIQKTPITKKSQFVYQEYENFFDEKMLEHINSNIDNLEKSKLRGQENQNRHKADYSNLLVRELTIIFSNATVIKALEEAFGTELTLSSLDIWYDQPPYVLKTHVDDPSIKLSLQIYLSTGVHPGTALHYSEDDVPFKIFDYKVNRGYSLLCGKNTYHSTAYPVQSEDRKSLYVRYQ